MQKITLIRLVSQTALSLLLMTQPCSHAAEPGLSYEQAQQLYAQGRWQQAFRAFGGLAEQGHTDAARIAALMARHGQVLYGQGFEAPPERLDKWLTLASQQRERSAEAASRLLHCTAADPLRPSAVLVRDEQLGAWLLLAARERSELPAELGGRGSSRQPSGSADEAVLTHGLAAAGYRCQPTHED